MAAFDTPWTDSMSTEYNDSSTRKDGSAGPSNAKTPQPTVAAFSPLQQTASRTLNRSSILIHQKSPLLVATPPEVTRALAYSHAFILPLNHLVGLLSWTSGDHWESFLLLTVFWFVVLYADDVVRWAGPLLLVAILMGGMYSRRYSPLSTKAWDRTKHKRNKSNADGRKSLDEILETLNEFTRRCDVLWDPLLRLTEFLSTQSSATSATTRPALTTLFIRILAFTPFWLALTLPPLRIINTQRAILMLGTVGLTWHSRPSRACRAILWRSRTVRSALSLITGLHFPGQSTSSSAFPPPPLPPRAQAAAAVAAKMKSPQQGITFTFSVFENQRRWLGLGWTASMLPGEGDAWSDEHNHPSPDPTHYQLPETENSGTKWRWVPGSDWQIEGTTPSAKKVQEEAGWTYYDNYWRDPRASDGFSRYTRRRKWRRDAELVEAGAADSSAGDVTPKPTTIPNPLENPSAVAASSSTTAMDSPAKPQRQGWFRRRQTGNVSTSSIESNGNYNNSKAAPDGTDSVSVSASTGKNSGRSRGSARSDEDRGSEDVHIPLDRVRLQGDWDRSVSENVWEGLS